MSDAVQQFITMVSAVVIKQEKEKPAEQRKTATIMAWCPACNEQTPHEHVHLGLRCLFYYSHHIANA